MKYLRDFGLKNQRVLLRVDFNVPIENSQIANDFRIRAILPTIEYLKKQQAKIIVATHFGRPNGKVVENLRVDLIGQRLAKLTKQPVIKLDETIGVKVEKAVSLMKSGDIVMLENVQFHPGERKNDPAYAKSLAKLADFFVLDAFGQAHRDYASITGIHKYLPGCAGLLLEKEIAMMDKVLNEPRRPLVVIIGGAKMATKTSMIKKFLASADDIILGGALANTVLWAKGIATGKSVVEKEMSNKLEAINLTNNKLHIPVDAVASIDRSGQAPNRVAPVGKTNKEEMILDIGPDTIRLYADVIKQAKMVLWNGPMGLFEVDAFASGTNEVAEAVVKSEAFTVIGGGDTISCLAGLDLLDKIDHVSTGGGAMLQYLGDGNLEGLEALASSNYK